MSKELIEQARDYTYQGDSWQLQQRLADLIEAQQKRIEELKAKMADDCCGCVGIHNNRLGVCTTCNKPVIGWWEVAKSAIEDLAAAQAQIRVLREALENTVRHFGLKRLGESRLADTEIRCAAHKALAQPSNDSALRELLKAERERCAKVADEWQTAIHDPRYQCDCAKAILTMEDK